LFRRCRLDDEDNDGVIVIGDDDNDDEEDDEVADEILADVRLVAGGSVLA